MAEAKKSFIQHKSFYSLKSQSNNEKKKDQIFSLLHRVLSKTINLTSLANKIASDPFLLSSQITREFLKCLANLRTTFKTATQKFRTPYNTFPPSSSENQEFCYSPPKSSKNSPPKPSRKYLSKKTQISLKNSSPDAYPHQLSLKASKELADALPPEHVPPQSSQCNFHRVNDPGSNQVQQIPKATIQLPHPIQYQHPKEQPIDTTECQIRVGYDDSLWISKCHRRYERMMEMRSQKGLMLCTVRFGQIREAGSKKGRTVIYRIPEMPKIGMIGAYKKEKGKDYPSKNLSIRQIRDYLRKLPELPFGNGSSVC